MAASIGVESDLVEVQVVQIKSQWHRRVKLGAFAWWRPDGCERPDGEFAEVSDTPPYEGNMCPVCWPVWPKVKGR